MSVFSLQLIRLWKQVVIGQQCTHTARIFCNHCGDCENLFCFEIFKYFEEFKLVWNVEQVKKLLFGSFEFSQQDYIFEISETIDTVTKKCEQFKMVQKVPKVNNNDFFTKSSKKQKFGHESTGYTLSVVLYDGGLRAWRIDKCTNKDAGRNERKTPTPCECEHAQGQDKTSQDKKVPGAPASVANFVRISRMHRFFCTARWDAGGWLG